MPRPDSIKAMGLKKYLNQTASEHNNYTYSDFVKFVSLPAKPTIVSLAQTFNVDRATMTKWIDIYQSEKSQVVK